MMTIAPRSLLYAILLCCLVGAMSSYVLYQARFLITGPQITLTEEPPTEHFTRTVTLTGTAINITHLWLNDRPIYTDELGTFAEALVLENGYTEATLKATDRYGRETTVVRQFVYTPASKIEAAK